jgi:malonyl CoA-acyl carrier protein transacylase
MTAYVFPGQGSQTLGMGKDLFDHYPEFVSLADDILGYSISDLCLSDPHQQLNQTQYTQPALFIVNALSYLKKQADTATSPVYLAGHSLGEYNAMFAAGVFDFATGLKLVQKRGLLMSQVKEGGMAAVVGLPAEKISSVLLENNLAEVSIANYNSYSQSVISGLKTKIDLAIPLFEEAGATLVISLKVSGAFHTVLMKPAQEQFADFLKNFTFSAPQIPVIANLTAEPYPSGASEISTLLQEQISHPVRWTATIENLLERGVTTFTEIGPGSVLSGLIRRIRNGQ